MPVRAGVVASFESVANRLFRARVSCTRKVPPMKTQTYPLANPVPAHEFDPFEEIANEIVLARPNASRAIGNPTSPVNPGHDFRLSPAEPLGRVIGHRIGLYNERGELIRPVCPPFGSPPRDQAICERVLSELSKRHDIAERGWSLSTFPIRESV